MSRSHLVLAATLLGLAALVGIARLVTGDTETTAAAPSEPPPSTATAPIMGSGPLTPAEEQPATELADDVRNAAGLAPLAVIDPGCALAVPLQPGDQTAAVACLEAQLIDAGVLTGVPPDEVFDDATAEAVRAFQRSQAIAVDGVVGPLTAKHLKLAVDADPLPPDAGSCPTSGRAAVVDRYHQRSWLCEEGAIAEVMPMTSALSQPDPGTYSVYAKDLRSSSDTASGYSEMTHFVAFTRGKYQGDRIAFHSVPTYRSGEFVQPLESVGTAELHGDSAGCIRVLPDDAELIWNWLDVGDSVVVVT